MWYYQISTGRFSRPFDDTPVFVGYSGLGLHKNRVESQCRKLEGPLPRGIYRAGRARSHPRLGVAAIPLTPHSTTALCGRSDFWVHGDNATGTASKGCIVLGRSVRDKIADGDIIVVVD